MPKPSAAPSDSRADLSGSLKDMAAWDTVHSLLEPWREVWNGDKDRFVRDHPAWMVAAAEELFAHDMCDAWNWNDYVKAATVIIARHFAAAERDIREQLAQHIYDETCRRAEDKMLKTGKLEGAHFAALKEVLGEIKAERVRGKGEQ